MGYALEVEMVRLAHGLDLITAPYVFDAEDATAMAEADADILVAHMGLTVGGAIGAVTAPSLEDCAHRIQVISDATHTVHPHVIVLCHGGPIAEPRRRAIHRRQHQRRRGILRRPLYGTIANRNRYDDAHPTIHESSPDGPREVDTRKSEESELGIGFAGHRFTGRPAPSIVQRSVD